MYIYAYKMRFFESKRFGAELGGEAKVANQF